MQGARAAIACSAGAPLTAAIELYCVCFMCWGGERMAGIGGRDEDGRNRRPDSDEDQDFKMESVRERIISSRTSRFNLIQKQLRLESNRRRFSRENLINGIKCLVIRPDSRYASSPTSFQILILKIMKRRACVWTRLVNNYNSESVLHKLIAIQKPLPPSNYFDFSYFSKLQLLFIYMQLTSKCGLSFI